MKLIVGLGNPGQKYKNTRHNVGFLAVDYFLTLTAFKATGPRKEYGSEVWELQYGEEKVFFLKPQTYMNDSGEAVREICNFYKLDARKDILVIHDEVDLPFGTIRVTDSSSAAGHNGIKSIIEHVGTQDFSRIRIGVETRASRAELPTDTFVLQNFTAEELTILHKDIFPKLTIEVEKFLGKVGQLVS